MHTPHNRAVDHLHLAVVGLHDGIHQAVPDARLAPTVEEIVGRPHTHTAELVYRLLGAILRAEETRAAR
jgi:hypothetical protein